MINAEGYILNRKYGFPGADALSRSESIFNFTNTSIERNLQNKILKGYSNSIEVSKYPAFYVDYVNRDDTKLDKPADFKAYWTQQHDVLSEEYFATLIYFASDVPEHVAYSFLEDKDSYLNL